jgi:hypothetical protein
MGAAVLALVVYGTVAYSVISWYEWRLNGRLLDHGVQGFFVNNWYVLLMLVLLVALPIRPASAPVPAAAPGHRDPGRLWVLARR